MLNNPKKKLYIIIITIFLFLGSLLTILLPNYLKDLIDNLVSKDYEEVRRRLIALTIIVVINTAFYMLALLISNIFIQNTLKTEKGAIYETILKTQYNSLSQFNAGNIINYFKYDLPTIIELEMTSAPNIIFSITKILIIFIFLFLMEIRLALVFVLLIPALLLILRLSNKYVEKNYIEYKELNDSELTIVDRDYQCIEQIKSDNLLSKHVNDFHSFLNIYSKNVIKLNTLSAAVSNIFELVCNLFMVALFFMGVRMIAANELTVGSLIAFYSYFQMIIPSIGYLSNINANIIKHKELSKGIMKINELPMENASSEHVLSDKIDIIFNNVALVLSGKTIFEGLSFSVEYGKRAALIGKNGSGKTSIGRLLNCIYKNDGGVILLNKKDITKYSVNEVRDKIKLFYQTPLFLHGTIEENITLFGKYNNNYWEEIKNEDYLKTLFNQNIHDLSDVINENKIGLSLGQQKIISLCRIIVQNPSVIILDEYFSNLDMDAKIFSKRLIGKYFNNKTIIHITHDNSEIRDMEQIIDLDDILRIDGSDDGRI
jgi:ABC-type multidrug transport system fused ATPase/permease subunit